jgi:hypothetical protein
MAGKSLTFVIEITVGTFNEQLQTKELVDEFSKALVEGVGDFAKNIAIESDGQLIGAVKILEQSTDWQ